MSTPAAFLGTAEPSAAYVAQAAGMLQVICCEPDPFTGERLNVGIIGIDAGGQRLVKVIDQVGRLECLYGPEAGQVVLLAQAAAESARLGLPSPSPYVVFDAPTPFFHSTLDDAVCRAFAELVTVAIPGVGRAKRQEQVSDEDAERSVCDEIRKLIGLDFNLLANTPNVMVPTDRGPWPLHIPLQPPDGVGTIRSADYGAETLRVHLFESVLDLECAARHRSRQRMGLFLLRTANRSQKEALAIDSVIDSIRYRSAADMLIDFADTPMALARRVVDWGRARRV